MKKVLLFLIIIMMILLSNLNAIGPYTDNGDGTVTDKGTGLMWQKSDAGVNRNWKNALAYCENLTFAGYKDWRLPNIQELKSIVKFDSYNPSVDRTAFDCKTDYYWSSTTSSYYNDSAWSIYFGDGNDYWSNKSSSNYVRCVRMGLSKTKIGLHDNSSSDYFPLPDTGQRKCYNSSNEILCPSKGEDFYGQDANYQGLQQKFQTKNINGEKIVEDLNTGLMWQQSDYGVEKNWQDANDYCNNLTLAGFNDWRLPTIFELSTIVNYATYNPARNKKVFGDNIAFDWSSTVDILNSKYAWGIYFGSGFGFWHNKSSMHYVRCVRMRLSGN